MADVKMSSRAMDPYGGADGASLEAGTAPGATRAEPPTLRERILHAHPLVWELVTTVLIWVVGLILNILPPQVQSTIVSDLGISKPLRKETISEALAGVLVVLLPALVIIGVARDRRAIRPVLGLLVATGLTLAITGALKNLVGQLRPDFLARCDPDPENAQVCRGDPKLVAEGRRSFPSGHSSVSAAGTIFLSLFLSAWLGHPGTGLVAGTPLLPYAADRARIHVPGLLALRMLAVVVPPTCGAAIALTRIVDNRHSYFDIFVGFALGTYVAATTARAYLRRRVPTAGAQYSRAASPAPGSAAGMGLAADEGFAEYPVNEGGLAWRHPHAAAPAAAAGPLGAGAPVVPQVQPVRPAPPPPQPQLAPGMLTTTPLPAGHHDAAGAVEMADLQHPRALPPQPAALVPQQPRPQ